MWCVYNKKDNALLQMSDIQNLERAMKFDGPRSQKLALDDFLGSYTENGHSL